MESRGTSDEIAHKRATPIGDPTQIKKPSVDKANGNPPVPRKTPEIRPPTSGQNIPTSGTDTGASTKGPSVWDSMKRQFGSTAGAAASGLGQAAGATRDVVGRGAGAVATGGRQAIERGREGLSTGAQRMGEIFRAGKKRVGETGEAIGRGSETAKGKIAEGGRAVGRQVAAGARGAQEFGGGLREGFGSYDPSTAKFDEIRSGGGKRDARGGLRRTAEGRKGQFAGKRSGARRVGQLFGATGRSAGEMAGEGARGVTQEEENKAMMLVAIGNEVLLNVSDNG